MAAAVASLLSTASPLGKSRRADWDQAEPEFAELARDINARLVRVYREMARDYEAAFVPGPGVAAVEAMLATFAPRESCTLVIANGGDAQRMTPMLDAKGKTHQLLSCASNEPLDLAAVKGALQARGDISHVALAHHDTSTGRLNELAAIGELCREHGARVLLDAVGSFGVESINADELPLDALAGTANNGLQGVPGISFVIARRDAWRGAGDAATGVCMDLKAFHRSQHGAGFSPVSQAVQPAIELRDALRELEDIGGWEQRRSILRHRAGRIAVRLKRLGLATLLPPQDCSCVLWSWLLPAGDSFERVRDVLRGRGFSVFAGEGEDAGRAFRIAHIGDLTNADLDRLETAFDECFGGGA